MARRAHLFRSARAGRVPYAVHSVIQLPISLLFLGKKAGRRAKVGDGRMLIAWSSFDPIDSLSARLESATPSTNEQPTDPPHGCSEGFRMHGASRRGAAF